MGIIESMIANEAELIGRLAIEIHAATEILVAGEGDEDGLPTAADLARKFKLRLENVKKKLRVLKDAHLIQPVTHNPKRYRLNAWALRELKEGDPFYELFRDPDSPYYLENGAH